MLSYASHFAALGVTEWDSGRHGNLWWARAVGQDDQEVIVHGQLTQNIVLDQLLAELSALVH